MATDNQGNNHRRRNAAIVSICAAAVVLFVCIFSLYHLPERDPVETPVMAVDDNAVSSPAGDFEETNDVMSATPEEASAMIGQLEMQYENAALNSEPYQAQQDGMRLALAYIKAGQKDKAKEFIQKLMESYPYDSLFVNNCKQFINEQNLK